MDNYYTHIPILAKCVSLFGGNVLEFGIGIGSSPLLCAMVDGELCSFESDKSWLNMMKSGVHAKNLWSKSNHVLHLVQPTEWDSVYGLIDWKKKWSIAFIDHAPGERRVVDIVKLKDLVDVIVYHDSEAPCYGWEALDGHFRWKYVYTSFEVTTTVVSNRIDLSVLS